MNKLSIMRMKKHIALMGVTRTAYKVSVPETEEKGNLET
jgi:hypothetical protein